MSGVRQINTPNNVNGTTVNTPYEDESKRGVKVEDFLQLMIAQLKNQDFMNPVDDTQYITQLAQFATMQSMQELSHYSESNYVMGMVGKTATAASMGIGGQVNRETGVISRVNLAGDTYTVTINGKEFQLNQLMVISDPDSAVSKNDLEAANKMSLYVNDIQAKTVKVSWDAPLRDEIAAAGLSYSVYYTDDGQLDFKNLSSVKKGKEAEINTTTKECKISGLTPGKTYFINVVVRNKNGDEAIYQHSTVITKEE